MPICKGADHLILPPPLPFVNVSIVQTVPTLLPPSPSTFSVLPPWQLGLDGECLPLSILALPKWSASLSSTPDFNLTPVFPVLLGNLTATMQATGNT